MGEVVLRFEILWYNREMDNDQQNQESSDKPVYLNGKLMPFNAEEMAEVLKVMSRSMREAGEQMVRESDEKVLGQLLEELEN